MKGLKGWLADLSVTGKIIAFTAAALVGGTIVAGAAADSPAKQPQVLQEATAQQSPRVEKKTVTEIVSIPFEKTRVNDNAIEQGKTQLKTAGVNGVRTITYEVTYTNDVQTDKKQVKEEVTTAPVAEVTAVGTYVKPKSNCDPNYSGACVPIASDVDCAGGSGNGPAYVQGPVYVVGVDIYDLDRDGNGVACQ